MTRGSLAQRLRRARVRLDLEDFAGAIEATAGTGYLVSRRTFRNFRLRAQFWADEAANSGIFLRVANPAEITPTSSYEVNIFDRRPDPSYGTGAIVGYAKVTPGH